MAQTLALPKSAPLVRELALAQGAALAIALLSLVRLPVPGTPVPITGQTLGVLLAGAVLGSRVGAGAVALYLLEGLLGLPFFAGGPAALLGPTGGYLLAFLPGALVAGRCGAWAGAAVILLAGALGLSALWSVPVGTALALGVVPFLPGEALKCALVARLAPPLQRVVYDTAWDTRATPDRS
jgi:biotin transport system substrate-specific component